MKLVKFKDSTGALGKEVFTINEGQSITDALMQHCPDGVTSDKVTVLLNGKKIALPEFDKSGTMINRGDEETLTMPLNNGDKVGIFFETKADPVSIFIAVVSLLSAVYAYLSIPNMPATPTNSTGDISENNKLYGQQNAAKLYGAIPDIYGTQVSYPDLIAPEATKIYQASKDTVSTANSSTIIQYMCIGTGFYDIVDEPKLGGTPLSQIPGSSYTIYEPTGAGNTGGTEDISKFTTKVPFGAQFSVPQIEGQELLGPESDDFIVLDGTYLTKGDQTLSEDNDVYRIIGNRSEFPDYEIGQLLCLINIFIVWSGEQEYFDSIIEVVGFGTIDLEITGDAEYVDFIVIENTNQRVWDDIHKVLFNEGEYDYGYEDDARLTTFEENTIGPYDITVPGNGITLDIVYPRGFKNSLARYEYTYQEIDRPGGVVTASKVTGEINDFPTGIPGLSTQVRSYDIFIANASYNDKKYYRVSITRKNLVSASSASPNASKFEALKSTWQTDVESGYDDFGHVTIIKVKIPGTQEALSPRENKVNVEVVRKTISYNMSTGEVDYELRPSKRFADAILHEFAIVFKQDPVNLDLDELYSIQEKLDENTDPENPEYSLGDFDYTFQDNDLGLEARIQTICNVARVQTYRDGKIWRFFRDESKEFVNGIITTRDLASRRNFNTVWTGRLPSEYDTIRLEYVEPVSNTKSYLYRSIDENGDIVDVAGKSEKVIELTGCRNTYQANNRIDLEIRRMLYDSVTVSDTMLSQGLLYDIGDIVMYNSAYEEDVFSGEIKKVISDYSVMLSEEIVLPVSEDEDENVFKISFTNKYGDLSASSIFRVSDSNKKVIIADEPVFTSVFIADNFNTQLGSRYIITRLSQEGRERYVIKDKQPSTDGSSVDLTLVKYSEDMYNKDKQQFASLEWTALPRNVGIPSSSVDEFSDTSVSDDGKIIDFFMVNGEHSRSTDGGNSFNRIGNPSTIPNIALDAVGDVDLKAACVGTRIDSTNTMYCILAYTNTSSESVKKLMKSEDGGATWDIALDLGEDVSNQRLQVQCSSDGEFFAVGFAGTTANNSNIRGYYSRNGGQSINAIYLPSVKNFKTETTTTTNEEGEEVVTTEVIITTIPMSDFRSLVVAKNESYAYVSFEGSQGGGFLYKLNQGLELLGPIEELYGDQSYKSTKNVGITTSNDSFLVKACSPNGKNVVLRRTKNGGDENIQCYFSDNYGEDFYRSNISFDLEEVNNGFSSRFYNATISNSNRIKVVGGQIDLSNSEAANAGLLNAVGYISTENNFSFSRLPDALNSGLENESVNSRSGMACIESNGEDVWVSGLKNTAALSGFAAIGRIVYTYV